MPGMSSFYDWWDNLNHLRRLEQCVGPSIEEISEDHLHYSQRNRHRYHTYHPFHHALHSRRHRRNSTMRDNDDKFAVSFDVHQFAPDEINIKLVNNNNIVIEARHEAKEDEHGWLSRGFVRRCMIPDDYNSEKVESHLSNDGVLFITAPRRKDETQRERFIPIEYTGVPVVFFNNESTGERENPGLGDEDEGRRIAVSVSAA